MFFEYLWILSGLVIADLVLSIVAILKLKKQERFQTGEAHANLELINQSLNRLSEITEKLEKVQAVVEEPMARAVEPANDRFSQSREQRAITMIRQGEDPRRIGRQLGISKSEIDLLIASEKLGNSRFNHKAKAHV